MKNSKGQELPQPYLDLAIMRREQYEGVGDDISMTDCFIWRETCEKFSWWYAVNKGETPEIPAASIAELGAWRKSREENKQSDFWGKAAMVADELRPEPDYKAMYDELCKRYKALDHNHNRLCQDYDFYKHRTNVIAAPTTSRNWIAECVPYQKCPVCDGEGQVRPLWNKHAQEPTYVKCDVCDGKKIIEMAAEGKKRGRL